MWETLFPFQNIENLDNILLILKIVKFESLEGKTTRCQK